MAVAWFISNVKRRDFLGRPSLYVAADDFVATFQDDAGSRWSAIYCGPNHTKAIVKVRASAATITTLAASPDLVRIPVALLDTALSSLTGPQRTAVNTQLLAMGYTQAQITAALPVLANATLRQLLNFATSTRGRARYDTGTDTFIADQGSESCEPISDLDQQV